MDFKTQSVCTLRNCSIFTVVGGAMTSLQLSERNSVKVKLNKTDELKASSNSSHFIHTLKLVIRADIHSRVSDRNVFGSVVLNSEIVIEY